MKSRRAGERTVCAKGQRDKGRWGRGAGAGSMQTVREHPCTHACSDTGSWRVDASTRPRRAELSTLRCIVSDRTYARMESTQGGG